MTTSLLLIRHPETALAGTFCGQLDPPVNERGQQQLAGLVETLASEPIDSIYSSDLQRASVLAEALAAHHAVPCRRSTDLREVHFGEWEGLTWQAIEARDPDTAAAWLNAFPHMPAPGGESLAALKARVLAKVDAVCAGPEQRIALVTHGGVLRILLQHLGQLTPEQAWQHPLPYGAVLRLARPTTEPTWRLIA